MQVGGIFFATTAWILDIGLPGVHCEEALGGKKGRRVLFVACFLFFFSL